MNTTKLSDFYRRLTRGLAALTLREHSDQQLVEMALGGHEVAAMEAMVGRHGPMVFRVCWRVLQQEQDAEDAFQATFLVLAHEIHTLRKHASLASWLHAVAHRLALKTIGRSAMRRLHEQRASQAQTLPGDEATWAELRSALDFELGRLPDKWRLPLILCYLQGRTQDESANQLGWSKRTLRRRLQEARAALGDRLKGRGLALPAALSAVLLADCSASASPMPGLVAASVEAALNVFSGQPLCGCGVSAAVANLAKGGLSMSAKKMLMVLALAFLTGTLAIGAGTWAGTGDIQLSGLAVVAGLNPHATQKEQDAECRQILDNAMKAHGGEEALQKLKYLNITSKHKYEGEKTFSVMNDNGGVRIKAQNPEFEVKTYINHSDQFKEDTGFGKNYTITEVFDGKQGWNAVNSKPFIVGDFSENQIARANRDLHAGMVTHLYALKDKNKGFSFAPLGESKVNGTTAVGVRVSCKNQPDVNLYFDKSSSLLVKATYKTIHVGGDNPYCAANEYQCRGQLRAFQ